MHHDILAFIYSMRKRRKLLQDAKYHVMARANRREMILEAREMKEMFHDIVERARKKHCSIIYVSYSFLVICFLLDNSMILVSGYQPGIYRRLEFQEFPYQ